MSVEPSNLAGKERWVKGIVRNCALREPAPTRTGQAFASLGGEITTLARRFPGFPRPKSSYTAQFPRGSYHERKFNDTER